MKKFYCNHCGKQLNTAQDYVDYDIDFENFSYTVDLCSECMDVLVEKIDTTLTRYSRGEE